MLPAGVATGVGAGVAVAVGADDGAALVPDAAGVRLAGDVPHATSAVVSRTRSRAAAERPRRGRMGIGGCYGSPAKPVRVAGMAGCYPPRRMDLIDRLISAAGGVADAADRVAGLFGRAGSRRWPELGPVLVAGGSAVLAVLFLFVGVEATDTTAPRAVGAGVGEDPSFGDHAHVTVSGPGRERVRRPLLR